MKLVVPFLLSVIFISCSAANKTADINRLQALFGNEYKFSFSSDSAYAIASKSDNKSFTENQFPLNFFLYNINTDSIIFKGNYPGGKISWLNTHQVQVDIIPGNITEEISQDELSFIYDLVENKKLKINGD